MKAVIDAVKQDEKKSQQEVTLEVSRSSDWNWSNQDGYACVTVRDGDSTTNLTVKAEDLERAVRSLFREIPEKKWALTG